MEDSIEDHKPSTSSNVGKINDGCFLVLKLSEDDPLFEKKTKLLRDKGFGPSDRVYLHDVSAPDVNAKLDALLERARIIHLNDVELYFGPMNVDTKGELFGPCNDLKGAAQVVFSPRNELEALNSILLQVDICSEENKGYIDSLKSLRDEIVKRIHNFGEKNTLKTKMVKEASDCENHLVQWAENSGLKSKLQIAYVEGAGRGALAAEDLGVGDIALEIPVSVIISEDLVYESDMAQILEKIDGISTETKLLLWSMRERHNIDSNYKLYFDSLPEQFNTGLSFGLEALMALDETLVSEELFQAKEHLRSEYDELFPALSISYPDLFSPEYYTWEQYLWACELWYSNSMKIVFPDGKLKTCLIPVAGFLNHSVCPHILHYGRADAETNTLKFPLSRPCKKGEQCYLSYGNLSSAHLLTFYGFLPQEPNPFDIIPLDIEAAPDCSSEEGYLDTATHMVRGTWFSANQDMFHYGLPLPLLEHLRSATNPGLKTMTLLQENLENEVTVLDNIHAIFGNMLDKLGDSNMDDRKNEKWDVKLAIKYKDLQRSILSSILTACYTGRVMVLDALEKCLAEDVRG